jgi:ABC-type transport system involved in multi-copper enzyme maturation permease subunit
MRWLIWKEYRNNRLIIVVGLGMLFLPHLIALAVGLRHPEFWKDCFQNSLGTSLFVTQVVLAFLGGNAIAGERTDRSAEFLACLPISRWRNLVSKLVLAPLAIVVICAVNFLILVFVSGVFPEFVKELGHARPDELQDFLFGCGCAAVTALTFFCVSWLFSSLLTSAVFSIAGGVLAPLAVLMVLQGAFWWFTGAEPGGPRDFESYWRWYFAVCLVLSAASFVSGTIFYLRRVEP